LFIAVFNCSLQNSILKTDTFCHKIYTINDLSLEDIFKVVVKKVCFILILDILLCCFQS